MYGEKKSKITVIRLRLGMFNHMSHLVYTTFARLSQMKHNCGRADICIIFLKIIPEIINLMLGAITFIFHNIESYFHIIPTHIIYFYTMCYYRV